MESYTDSPIASGMPVLELMPDSQNNFGLKGPQEVVCLVHLAAQSRTNLQQVTHSLAQLSSKYLPKERF